MSPFTAESLAHALIILGAVIVISALLSGLVERSGVPYVAVFLALGAAIGPAGLGLLDVGLDSDALRVVSTLSLSLVLFTDAVSLNLSQVQKNRALVLRLLGPGSLLCAAVIAVAGWWLLGLGVAAAAMVGAALASTDPVLLRGILRRPGVPESTRLALKLEGGLNDVVLLPVVMVALAVVLHQNATDGAGWAKLGLGLFILGPGAGVLVGLVGVSALDLVRKRVGVRRDYESLYSLGLAFLAFATAELVHGSGFLAAFAAGLTIALLDVELCDCFVEYGEVTAEMLLLVTFVLLGTSLMWSGFATLSVATVLFVGIAVLARLPVYLLSLAGSGLPFPSRRQIAWFGPRGLSSLLLILLPVFAGVPGANGLFSLCSLVVLASIVVQCCLPVLGVDAVPEAEKGAPERSDSGGVATGDDRQASQAPKPAVQEQALADEDASMDRERISLEQVQRLRHESEPVSILDVRTERNLELSTQQVEGAVRVSPDQAVEQVRKLGLPRDHWLVAYCA